MLLAVAIKIAAAFGKVVRGTAAGPAVESNVIAGYA